MAAAPGAGAKKKRHYYSARTPELNHQENLHFRVGIRVPMSLWGRRAKDTAEYMAAPALYTAWPC